jgi:hypothetical protein
VRYTKNINKGQAMANQSNDIDASPKSKLNNEEPKHKKHSIWPWVLVALVIIIIIPVIVVSVLGFVPGISSVIGTNKPKDLGVKYSEIDYANYQLKTGAQFLDNSVAPIDPATSSKEIFTSPKQMDVTLMQEEITAMLNSTGWASMPIKNTQIRLGDGAIELSGNVNSNALSEFAQSIGGTEYSQANIDTAASWAKMLGDPPIYLKANASITNNVLTFNVTEAKVGFFNIPSSITSGLLKAGSYNIKNNSALYDVQSANATNGQLHFVGIAPTTIYINKN